MKYLSLLLVFVISLIIDLQPANSLSCGKVTDILIEFIDQSHDFIFWGVPLKTISTTKDNKSQIKTTYFVRRGYKGINQHELFVNTVIKNGLISDTPRMGEPRLVVGNKVRNQFEEINYLCSKFAIYGNDLERYYPQYVANDNLWVVFKNWRLYFGAFVISFCWFLVSLYIYKKYKSVQHKK